MVVVLGSGPLTIVLSALLCTSSHYPFGIFWPLCCLFFLDLRILITPLVSFDHCIVCSSYLRILITPLVSSSFDYCITCSSSIYVFSLPLWYLHPLTIVLSVLLRFTDSHYPFGIFIFWLLYYLFFLDLRILITPLVSSFVHCVVCSS